MAYNIYWGDPHGHSGFSECYWKDTDFPSCDPDTYYKNARRSARLDFATLTDHDLNIAEEDWMAIVESSERANAPGEFVTIPGYEWTSSRYGHQNLYFLKGPFTFVKSRLSGENTGPMDRTALWAPSEAADWMPPAELWNRIGGLAGNVITVPHHVGVSQMPYDWNYHNPAFQPVTEITSLWGNFESPETDIGRGISDVLPDRYVRDALNRGYRLGFIGGGDSHDGHPGEAYFGPRKKRNVVEGLILGRSSVGRSIAEFISDETANTRGLTAVLAEELTREAVFGAIASRRCYATTGARIEVVFTVNGRPMGSDFGIGTDEKVSIGISVKGKAPLRSVELVRNNGVRHAYAPDGVKFSTELTDTPGRGTTWYYLRVLQADGHRAWSSPVWVSRPGFSFRVASEGGRVLLSNRSYPVAVPHSVYIYSAEPFTYGPPSLRGEGAHDGYSLSVTRSGEHEFVVDIAGRSSGGVTRFTGSAAFRGAALFRFRTFNFRTVKYGGDLYSAKGSTVRWDFSCEGESKALGILVRAREHSDLSLSFRPRPPGRIPLHINGRKGAAGELEIELQKHNADAIVARKKLAGIGGFGETFVAPAPSGKFFIDVRSDGASLEPLNWPGERSRGFRV